MKVNLGKSLSEELLKMTYKIKILEEAELDLDTYQCNKVTSYPKML